MVLETGEITLVDIGCQCECECYSNKSEEPKVITKGRYSFGNKEQDKQ